MVSLGILRSVEDQTVPDRMVSSRMSTRANMFDPGIVFWRRVG